MSNVDSGGCGASNEGITLEQTFPSPTPPTFSSAASFLPPKPSPNTQQRYPETLLPVYEPGSVEEALAAIEAEDAKRAVTAKKKTTAAGRVTRKQESASVSAGGGSGPSVGIGVSVESARRAVERGVDRGATARIEEPTRVAGTGGVGGVGRLSRLNGAGGVGGSDMNAAANVKHAEGTGGGGGGRGGAQGEGRAHHGPVVIGGAVPERPPGLVRARRLIRAAASPQLAATLEEVFGDGRVKM